MVVVVVVTPNFNDPLEDNLLGAIDPGENGDVVRSVVEIIVEYGKSLSPSVLAPPRYQLEPLTYTERGETCSTDMRLLF